MRFTVRPPSVYALALVVLATILSLGNPSPSWKPPIAGAIVVNGPTAVPDLTGHWEGTWTDTRYAVSGAMTLDIALNGNDYSATGTIDVSEIDPILGTLSGTASGTITGNTMSFDFGATDLGTGSGAFTDGTASGSGTVTAPLNFGAFEFSGTASTGMISGTFDFLSPTGGNGVATLTRVVATDATTWSEVKSSYR